ncbi:Uu.00g031960.m01.CDS01 [Anthostomella pinea]|uniref:Uu.00g031960.m01.CDS01 n=1 Tax=Anthostomella pinea TaxID=933095 RepID=A0AAI8YD94_9PEZI|nr:Uu.00g031960.m01.CDS01 [Anthostomella pinea]
MVPVMGNKGWFAAATNLPQDRGDTVVDRGVLRTSFRRDTRPSRAQRDPTAHFVVVLDEVLSARHSGRGSVRQPATGNLPQRDGLCYVFRRATKAFSICTPASYADVVCERPRCYLSRLFDASPDASVTGRLLALSKTGVRRDGMLPRGTTEKMSTATPKYAIENGSLLIENIGLKLNNISPSVFNAGAYLYWFINEVVGTAEDDLIYDMNAFLGVAPLVQWEVLSLSPHHLRRQGPAHPGARDNDHTDGALILQKAEYMH